MVKVVVYDVYGRAKVMEFSIVPCKGEEIYLDISKLKNIDDSCKQTHHIVEKVCWHHPNTKSKGVDVDILVVPYTVD